MLTKLGTVSVLFGFEPSLLSKLKKYAWLEECQAQNSRLHETKAIPLVDPGTPKMPIVDLTRLDLVLATRSCTEAFTFWRSTCVIHDKFGTDSEICSGVRTRNGSGAPDCCIMQLCFDTIAVLTLLLKARPVLIIALPHTLQHLHNACGACGPRREISSGRRLGQCGEEGCVCISGVQPRQVPVCWANESRNRRNGGQIGLGEEHIWLLRCCLTPACAQSIAQSVFLLCM